MSPTFSILLPAYQGIAFLDAAVRSVTGQTYSDWELIVGDDGSTDGSREYLLALKDPRVRFIPSNARQGLFPLLNRLLIQARGTFVRVLCQDDVLESTCLEKEHTFLLNHPHVSFTIAKSTGIDEEGNFLSRGELFDLPPVLPSSLAVQHFFYHGCIAGNLSTVCVRRSLFVRLGHFNEAFRVSSDYDLWSRMAKHASVGILHDHLVRIRHHPAQLSRAHESAVRFVSENRRIRQQLLPHLPADVHVAAKRFERARHHVLDLHLSLRCLLSGQFRSAWRIFKALGPMNVIAALGIWLWTFNNRRIRPQAPWVLSPKALQS